MRTTASRNTYGRSRSRWALIWVVRSFLLEVNNTKTQQLAAGVYLQAEQPGGHEPKIASFFVGLDTLVANKPMDAWVELTNAPPTLHLRLARQAGSGDATTLRVSPTPPHDVLCHLEIHHSAVVLGCGCGRGVYSVVFGGDPRSGCGEYVHSQDR